MPRPPTTILWFRQDLRLADHPALHAALTAGQPVLPVYIWSPEEDGRWPAGAGARWWIHHSLARLDEGLRARGARLLIRRGPVVATLRELCAEAATTRIFFHRRYEPAARSQEEAVLAAFPPDAPPPLVAGGARAPAGPPGAIRAHRLASALLFEPEDVATKEGRPFQVFTPFWKACLARPEPATPLPGPRSIPGPARWPRSLALADLELEPQAERSAGFRAAWKPGEAGAKEALTSFLRGAVGGYPQERDRPDRAGTSRLSPHLHHGEITPRQVWHALSRLGVRSHRHGILAGSEAYLRQVGWREFAYHLLAHFPQTADRPLRAEFSAFPWARDRAGLRAWQQGRTGYPLVDAGMRELWATGWMHNRVRMVAASFLVKDLLLPWRDGARWFWDTLVDADLAINTLGWQWTAGCGADAAPYYRIFNPQAQQSRFDPDGTYVQTWVPESLASPASDARQDTAEAGAGSPAGRRKSRAGPYPAPIVDHAAARARALAALESIRRGKR